MTLLAHLIYCSGSLLLVLTYLLAIWPD